MVAGVYHAWRGDRDAAQYSDVPGFCVAATIDDMRTRGHILTPGRYVVAAATEGDGEPFQEKMIRLATALQEEVAEAERLDEAISINLKELGYGG